MSKPLGKSFPITQHIVALICFFLSGFAGLVYEVAWIRQAALLFGSTTFAVSAVLAVFFLGLAIGAHLFGRIGQRTSRPLILFAYIEIGLGLLALISPYVFDFADFLYGIAYRILSDDPLLRFTTRLLLVALVVLPPTVLMGGTLPLFCRQYSRNSGTIARAVGLLYGVNTLGAALGCAATGFIFLPDLGLRGAIYIGVVCNIVSGLVVRALSISRDDVFPSSAQSRAVSGRLPRSRIVFVLFFAVGFVALGAEVLWVRYLGLLINNTVYTYTLALSVVLIGLVLGSILAAQFSDKTDRRAHYFGALQIATGLIVLALLMLPPETWRGLGNDLYIYFAVLLPPAVLSGAAFPLAIRLVISNAEYTSGMAGNLIAVNTLGGILGSLLIGFAGIPFFGLEKSLFFITGANLVIGISAWFCWIEDIACSNMQLHWSLFWFIWGFHIIPRRRYLRILSVRGGISWRSARVMARIWRLFNARAIWSSRLIAGGRAGVKRTIRLWPHMCRCFCIRIPNGSLLWGLVRGKRLVVF